MKVIEEKKKMENTPVTQQLVRDHYRTLTKRLIEMNCSITTMESATGGQVASLITDTEGSSQILKGAFVTYCNEAKIRQGVPEEIISTYTVYSRETAAAMAAACRKSYQADIGIGVTGTMGNVDPANPEASVPGELWFGIDLRGKVQTWQVFIPAQPDRLMYKLYAAEKIYEELMPLIGAK